MPSQKELERNKICIIDDDPLILSSVKRALSSSGYNIYTASDRDEFLKLLSIERFDLVITDYYLKDCTALDIKALLHESAPETLLIVMSGKCLPEGFALPYIRKLFSIKELRRIVDGLMRGTGDES